MKAAIVTLFLIGLSLVFIALLGYSTIQETQREYGQTQGNTKANENNYPPIKTALRVGFVQIGSFVHNYRDEIVAVGTLFIAAFTVVLAFATGFLYSATHDLVRQAKQMSETQLRAFVIAKGFHQAANVHHDEFGKEYIKEWVFWYELENVGLTTAIEVKVWINAKVLPISKDDPPKFEWVQTGSAVTVGPRQTGQTTMCIVPIRDMIDLWERTKEIYLAGRIEYRDIFNPSFVHHFEQCVVLDLYRHPGDVERGPEAEKNLLRVNMRAYGPQNSAA